MNQPKARLSDIMRLRKDAYERLDEKLHKVPLEVVTELSEHLDVTERLITEGTSVRFELHFVRREDD